MLTEAALCLAEHGVRIAVGGGFWTLALTFGPLLRDRIIARAGLSFEMIDSGRGPAAPPASG